MTTPTRRLRACVEAWPEAETGAYDPHCCRFPKSCSATIYDEGTVAEEDLEPAPTVPAATAPLARVNDVIQHGQPIPGNVVKLIDNEGDVFWRDPEREGRWAWRVAGNYNFDDDDSLRPFRVVEVDPEPQPAGRKLIGPAYAHLDAPCTDEACYEPESRPAGEDPRYAPMTDEQQRKVRGEQHECEMLEVLKERDDNAEWADRLAHAIAEHLGIDIGEHSNANLPWQAALIALTDAVSPEQPAAGSGPVVLSLPQVPDGAVALVDSRGERFVRADDGTGCWRHADVRRDGTFTLASILNLGSVAVEFAPPREPRTWPMIDHSPEGDLPATVTVSGHGMHRLRADGRYASASMDEDPDDVPSRHAYTLAALRVLGEVREVLG